MRVTLLRHAPSRGNLLGQYIGSSDVGLCREGRQLAESVAPRAEVQRVYTSGLRRSLQTAAILYPGAEAIACKDFDEMNFGRFEEKTWRDLEQDACYRAWVEAGCETACPGGESKAGFTERCVHSFRAVADHEAASGAQELHCVVHGGTIMAILSELALPMRDYFDWPSDFCGGYLLEYNSACARERALQLLAAIRPKEKGEVQA